MRLKVKYLAAYLPYQLKLKTIYDDDIKTLIPNISMQKAEDRYKFCTLENIENGGFLKPILRPLYDLVIDENLIEDFIGLGNWCNAYDEYIQHWYPDSSYAKQAPYVIFEYFLVNHIDVFGLIEKGLAVDVNSLNGD